MTDLSAYDDGSIPEHLLGGLRRYLEHGLQPGSFLTALLAGDFMTAVRHMDSQSKMAIGDILCCIVACLPASSYGSDSSVDGWIAAGGLEGIAASAKLIDAPRSVQ